MITPHICENACTDNLTVIHQAAILLGIIFELFLMFFEEKSQILSFGRVTLAGQTRYKP